MKKLISLRCANHLVAIKSKFFAVAVALGFLGLLFPSQANVGIPLLLWMALIEELVFRFLLQEQLEKCNFPQGRLAKVSAISHANIIASLLFALVHLFNQPPLYALATFFPSLIFGLLWTKYRAIGICVFVHFFYNLMFFT